MAKVAIIMGSDSDMPVMAKAIEMLEKLGIEYEVRILSAHRLPKDLALYAGSIEELGFDVVIAGAGKAAALPGICAAHTIVPVIGVPMKTSDLGGLDSLYSIVQMPTGVPVATVAINGAANAALLAAQIIAVFDPGVADRVKKYRADQADACLEKDKKVQQEGYEAFL